ncbi:MAG: bacillithiol biosynthesis deacetylase BshB1 [Calditrichaeota bacterium]|nr:bacillithiol biosynthesis deacetylase BshB1 [Calditrichota bacterium]
MDIETNQIDLLALGAHSDDVELGCGGTVAALAHKGYNCAIVDVTEAALSTRGNILTRQEEAACAAHILGALRYNLQAQESQIYPNFDNLLSLVSLIRALKPKLMLTHYWEDRHPDHIAVSRLTQEAVFWAGVAKFGDDHPPHRPRRLGYYFARLETIPTLIVDISDTFDTKMAAVRAYRSQFFPDPDETPNTFISRPEFLDRITTRARGWGDKISARYGEAFLFREVTRVSDLMKWNLEQGDLG